MERTSQAHLIATALSFIAAFGNLYASGSTRSCIPELAIFSQETGKTFYKRPDLVLDAIDKRPKIRLTAHPYSPDYSPANPARLVQVIQDTDKARSSRFRTLARAQPPLEAASKKTDRIDELLLKWNSARNYENTRRLSSENKTKS